MQKICTNLTNAEKYYGDKMAEKIQLRIDQIKSADSVEILLQYHIGRCHSLTGSRNNQYAMDLVHPYRLIFTVDKSNCVQVAEIIEIVDYH